MFCSRDEQTDKLLWKVVSVMTGPWNPGRWAGADLHLEGTLALHPKRAGLGPGCFWAEGDGWMLTCVLTTGQ